MTKLAASHGRGGRPDRFLQGLDLDPPEEEVQKTPAEDEGNGDLDGPGAQEAGCPTPAFGGIGGRGAVSGGRFRGIHPVHRLVSPDLVSGINKGSILPKKMRRRYPQA